MSYIDLQPGLDGWDYDPERISARKLIGGDGKAKIQLRVELGLLQMEVEGRPDGREPHGKPSYMDYFTDQLHQHEERNGTKLGFALTTEDCCTLQEEASLYYKRYVASFVLEEYSEVSRDTTHNLAILDLCREYGMEKKDRRRMEVYRPYILMMNARACAHAAQEEGEPSSAIAHVNRGLVHISQYFDEIGRPDAFEKAEEVKILMELRTELNSTLPADCLINKRKALKMAIEEERFEDAASLRDEIDSLAPEAVMSESGMPSELG